MVETSHPGNWIFEVQVLNRCTDDGRWLHFSSTELLDVTDEWNLFGREGDESRNGIQLRI